jgi:DNA repair protein SbcC/Rad50
MIPRKLHLRGFMCYREEQTIDFSGLRIASLTGDNGHGKSALLDAITWALWGRARARRDDDLITQSENEMWVELEFALGPQVYRVTRQRSKKGRTGQSDLHFCIWNPNAKPEENPWQLLDEGNLNQRQGQINRALRLDYETFVNSAFILQGRADSFTTKSPAERKQILSDILGLARYDLYEERAKTLVQSRKERTIGIDSELKSIDAEMAQREAHEAALAQARAEVESATATLQLAEAEQRAAAAAVQALRSQDQQLADLKGRLARGERELAALRDLAAKEAARLAEIEKTIGQREEIEQGWRDLQSARAAEADWNDRLRRHSALREKLSQVQREIDAERSELTGEQRRLQARVNEFAAKANAVGNHRRTLAEAQAAVAELAQVADRREEIVAAMRQLAEEGAGLRHELDRVKQEGQAVKDRLDMLREAGEARCPVCSQPLSPEHREQVAGQLSAEREALAERFVVANTRLKTLGERNAALEAEERELSQTLRKGDARRQQAAKAEAAVGECESAAAELITLRQQLGDLEGRLQREAYASEAREALARLREELTETGYSSETHEKLRGDIAWLQPFDERYQRHLLPALDRHDEAQRRCEDLAEQIAGREEELAQDRARRDELQREVAGLPALQLQLRQADENAQVVGLACRRAQQKEGAAQQQLDSLERREERRGRLREQLDALNMEISLYGELRDAFGKKGLQAMIIESAIPEIEVEANRLLQRMSEGRMNLRLETQRDKVSGGGVIETLDIILADELGARPYELFSGGESFRANLALRIALSNLLARRAGAQLQTLVIDEGFGSQDARSLSLVVETINAIKDDFQLILVISHIEELKDQFGARIDVLKGIGGSRATVA